MTIAPARDSFDFSASCICHHPRKKSLPAYPPNLALLQLQDALPTPSLKIGQLYIFYGGNIILLRMSDPVISEKKDIGYTMPNSLKSNLYKVHPTRIEELTRKVFRRIQDVLLFIYLAGLGKSTEKNLA